METSRVGGALMQFRLGAMPRETATASIELFMREVAPQFRGAGQR